MTEPEQSATPPRPESGPPTETARELMQRIGGVIVAAGLTIPLPVLGGYLLVRNNAVVVDFIRGLGGAGPPAYAGFMALVVGVALLPTWVGAVLAGFLFGGVKGTGAALGGIVIGAAVGYLVGSVISGDRARRLVNEHARWRAVEEALLESGFWRALWVVALVRLPSTPFAMTNLVMAAVRAPFLPYLLGTFLGVIPRTVLWAVVGKGLHSFSQKEVGAAGLPWWAYGIAFGGLVVALLVLGHIARTAMERVTGPGAGKQQSSNQQSSK